ncbi:MAG TPA: SAM-dependent methyltransferase [Blastocatellia bacterium]|nr:SAM-dependent methyltransferase [Blastocatellia bacterium]
MIPKTKGAGDRLAPFSVLAGLLVQDSGFMNPVEIELIDRIDRKGPITIRDFMETVLYNPTHGYYNTPRPKIGPAGDYYTSSNVHAAFGEVLAKAISQMWANAGGSAERMTLVEIGAGTGQLAYDILRALNRLDQQSHGLRYVIVEQSKAMRAIQKGKLERWLDRVEWFQLADLSRLEGIVLSNELFDSLPVHRVRRKAGGWQEQYVGIAGVSGREAPASRLTLIWGELSDSSLANYLGRYGDPIIEDQIVEVNLAALALLSEIAQVLVNGFVITIDYGDTAERLYSPSRRAGTIRSFYRHSLNTGLLDRPGEQDMTASVNFTALIDRGRDIGLEPVSFEAQTSFLIRMGLAEIVAAAASDEYGADIEARLALKNLFVPGGISDSFRVLIQKRG